MAFKDIERYIDDDKKRPWFLKYSLFLFWLYYFPHFFTSKSAPFHKVRTEDLLKDKNIMLIAFRESAKTVRTMIYIIYSICYKKHNFVLFYSYEQTLSASRLFDIIVQLKTNKRIIKDFGILFPDGSTQKEDGLQKKTASEFITTNYIKFKSMSINTSSRWLLYTNKVGAYRPDLVIFDDVDVLDSVRNPDLVSKNIEFLENEVFGGLDSNCKTIFLWNIITNIWVVPYFEGKINNDKNWIHHRQPVIENWEITRDRFVMTDDERDELLLKGIKKISIETKKRDQKEQFEPNFMLIPSIRLWNPVFKHDIIHNMKEPSFTLDDRYKELKIYQPPQECIFGVDSTWWWENGDYWTIIARNKDRDIVLSFQWKYEPYQLAEVVEYIFNLWYSGLIVPESNSIWIATIDKLKATRCKHYLYTQKTLDKITQRSTKKYWFNTNAKSKELIISRLKESIHEWQITQTDTRLKLELLHYYYDERGSMNALVWHNDDLVMADALCEFWLRQRKSLMFN